MNNPDPHPLSLALEVEAGRRAQGPAQSASWAAYASRLALVRARVLASPACPTAVLRRVQGLFSAPSEGPLVRVFRLVFDSRRDVAPALRGAGSTRELRYEGDRGALDLRIEPRGRGVAAIQLAVEPAGLATHVTIEAGSTQADASIDDTGFAVLEVADSEDDMVVIVREGDTELFRTPPLPVGE